MGLVKETLEAILFGDPTHGEKTMDKPLAQHQGFN